MEYQLLRVPACRISPARLVENQTQTPKAMIAPEATIVFVGRPARQFTPARGPSSMKKLYVSACG